MQRPQDRGRFLQAALDSLGPSGAARAKAAADRLIKMGYRQDVAFEDAAAHLVMHATTRDLTDRRRSRKPSLLPRLDAMSRRVSNKAQDLRSAAADHLAPLTEDNDALRKDLGALYNSPAGRGMGQVTNGESTPNGNGTPAEAGLVTPRNMLIAGGVGLGAWLLFSNRKKIAKNVKKILK